ncbi:hypothetical protein M422DRAFT_58673 [Sphaerobolus stellatus SS14]|nr:hypothetical protein M422DRAFT_58673 [Sphaerobolus stellatus SS14]
MTVIATPRVSRLPATTKRSTKSAVTTLRSLYNRAAKAFLQRDVALTHSLLISAFYNLNPPPTHIMDPLSSHRRKWDILRITLETTLYTSSSMSMTTPDALQAMMSLSAPSFIITMHNRSLQLFTPVNRPKPSAEFLPSQILITLVLAAVKLDCAPLAREMIEGWLGHRNQAGYDVFKDPKQLAEEAEGYEKVLEVYCLHVLPRLDDWEYAREFLRYENELAEVKRAGLFRSLEQLHAEHLANLEKERERQLARISPSSSRTPTPRPPTITPSTPDRSPSPCPSVASTSTTSTHTAVPLTRNQNGLPSALLPLATTSRPEPPAQLQPPSRSSTVVPRSSRTASPLPISPNAPPMPLTTVSPPSLLAVLKTSLIPHLTKSKLSFFAVMCLVSLVSFVFRIRRRRARISRVTESAKLITVSLPRVNTAEKARQKLNSSSWWGGMQKAVVDTVKMAGSGLV